MILLLCSALESCKDGGFSVDVDSTELPVSVDIHVGQSIRIADIGIVLKFEGVSQDTRSITPTGLALGNAYVKVFVLNGDGTSASYVLNTPGGIAISKQARICSIFTRFPQRLRTAV